MEKEKLKEVLKGKNPSEVKLHGVVDGGSVFNQPLTYFEGDTIDEMVDDLFETMRINPPSSMELSFDDHSYEL